MKDAIGYLRVSRSGLGLAAQRLAWAMSEPSTQSVSQELKASCTVRRSLGGT
jgi:hypothetical protein